MIKSLDKSLVYLWVTSCAPYLANIFLHMYEYDYLRGLVEKGEMENAWRLANTFRYQDDCIALNDNGVWKTLVQNLPIWNEVGVN